MAMSLKAEKRPDLRGSVTRKIRKQGYVPAVVYGNKTKSQPISVEAVDFLKTVREVGRNGLISLEVEKGTKHQVMVHDLQMDPLKGDYLHIDFFEVDMSSEIEANVPVRLTGEARGVSEGGVLSQLMYEITVRSLPADIPEEITLDVSSLAIGDSIQIRDVRGNVPVQVVNEDEETVVTVQPPATEKEEETEAAVTDNEPEVINEKEEPAEEAKEE